MGEEDFEDGLKGPPKEVRGVGRKADVRTAAGPLRLLERIWQGRDLNRLQWVCRWGLYVPCHHHGFSPVRDTDIGKPVERDTETESRGHGETERQTQEEKSSPSSIPPPPPHPGPAWRSAAPASWPSSVLPPQECLEEEAWL